MPISRWQGIGPRGGRLTGGCERLQADQGIGPRGERLTGEMDASSPAVVRSRLRAERIRPLDQTIRPKRSRFETGLAIPSLGHKVRQKDLVVFTRQFATMIDAGLPLIRRLDIADRQTDNPALQDILKQVRHDVANGTPLAEAMAKRPEIFSDLYTSMVSAGEAGGILDTILTRRRPDLSAEYYHGGRSGQRGVTHLCGSGFCPHVCQLRSGPAATDPTCNSVQRFPADLHFPVAHSAGRPHPWPAQPVSHLSRALRH